MKLFLIVDYLDAAGDEVGFLRGELFTGDDSILTGDEGSLSELSCLRGAALDIKLESNLTKYN